MTRTLAYVLLLLCLTAVGHAQERTGADDDREQRLETYLRTGRYADARQLIDAMLAVEPREDLKNVRAVFASGPNMRVRRASATFACKVTATGVSLPLAIEGRRVQFLLDTGANVSMMSDAEATRLGLVTRGSDGRASDLAGGSTGVRTAIARRVVIGRTVLQDVPFLVTPADQMPWKELPPGQQGMVGLPLAIALDVVRWNRDGMCHSGSAAVDRSAAARPSALRFDKLHVIANVEFGGKRLEFILDSGNQAGTQLWERFGADFPSLVKERGRQGSVRVTQIGGAADRDVILIPGLQFEVGGKDTRLADGPLFSKPVGNAQFHGLLGMDVLSQADDVTIDFLSMTLTLR